MSIHFISGKPGGGKTLYSVKLIIDELVYGHRCVITNVPLKLGELNAYLQKKYPHKTIDLHQRVRLFSEEEMKGFFTIRPVGSQGCRLLTKEEWQRGDTPDYSKITDHGVAYFVDEVHIGFNARAWMETGRDVLYYLSQHRKLGDTVVCITQAIMNVDKQFRSVTQDYTYLRNLSKEKLSKFRLPSIFIRQTYSSPATDNSQPMETGSFRLDVSGMAACYDTAVGVGIHGRGADTSERKTGLPWWVFVLLILVGVWAVAFYVPDAVANMFSRPLPKSTSQSLTNSVQYVAPGQQFVALSHREANEPAPLAVTNVITVVSADRLLGIWRFILSDGTDLRQGDERLKFANRNGLLYGGVLYPWAKPGTVPAASFSDSQPLTAPVADVTRTEKKIFHPGENWSKMSAK